MNRPGQRKKANAKRTSYKVVVEKHDDGYVAYPLGLNGVVVGEGDTYDSALKDVTSAIQFHIDTFGPLAFRSDSPVLEAFVAEAEVLTQRASNNHD